MLIIPRKDRPVYPKRTLENMKEDRKKFEEEFNKDTKKAKFCHNVIGEPLFNVDLTQVVN